MAQEDIEQKIVLNYETNADQASETVNNLTDNIDRGTEAQTRSATSTRAQGQAIRELAPAATGAIDSLKTMGKAMWALVANPLGAVLTAIAVVIGVLFLAFKSFQPLVDKVEQSFAALGAVVNVIKNTFIAVVMGTKSLGEAFGGLSDDMSDAAKRTMVLVKAQQDLEDVMKSQEVTTARNRAEINKLNVELKNRTLSEEQRLKIADKIEQKINQDYQQRKKNVDQEVRLAREAIAIKAKFTDDEIKLLKRTGDATKELAESRGGNYDEEFDRLNAARKAAIALEDEATVNTERIYNKRDKLEDDRIAKEEKRASDAKARAEKEASARVKREEEAQKIKDAKLRKEIDNAYALKLEQDQVALDVQTASDKRIEEQTEKDAQAGANRLQRIKGEYEEEMAIKQAMLKQEQEIQDAKVSIAEQGIRLIANVFGKSKAVQKAAIIAENAIGIGKMIIANNLANIGALATPQAIATSGASAVPVIALNNISTGIGVASSIAATAKALKAVGGGSVGGGGAQTSGGRTVSQGASATPQVNFQASSENQIGNTVAGRLNAQPPIRVTVLESDITKTQGQVQAKVVSNSF
jgi:hypothetical protein